MPRTYGQLGVQNAMLSKYKSSTPAQARPQLLVIALIGQMNFPLATERFRSSNQPAGASGGAVQPAEMLE